MKDGNWNKVVKDWREVKQAWRYMPAPEQDGWTHLAAQKVRVLCKRGPVLAAHLILVLLAWALLVTIGLFLWAWKTTSG